MNNFINNYKVNSNENSNYIDLNKIYRVFWRNKKLIASFSFIFFIFAFLFSLTLKRTWGGQFQIVLNSPKIEKNPIVLPNFSFLQNNNLNSLNTEVEILQSPSVLMPVFEFVNSKKNINKKINKSFLDWRNKNLEIDLKEDTSVLEISYKDKNKNLILPVLRKISAAYQNYSGRSKIRNNELTRKYLTKQIAVYKNKSSNSIKIAQEFAIDQDLTILDVKQNVKDIKQDKETLINSSLFNVDIERARVNAANTIRKLELQIESLENLSENDEKFEFFSIGLPKGFLQNLPNELQKLDALIIETESKYTNKDITVYRLKKKREILVSLLKQKAISFLKTEILKAETRMKAATRPKGTIIKYNELIREAKRNENTLIGLENELTKLDLTESKLDDPWELITKPTIKNDPVAPSRKNIGFAGLIIGFLTGLIYSYYIEKKTDKIFEEKEVESILKTRIIESINLENISKVKDEYFFINEVINSLEGDDLVFITDNLSENEIEKLKRIFFKNNKKIYFQEDITNDLENKTLIFIGNFNKIKLKNLQTLIYKMDILKKFFHGIILAK